MDLMKCAKIATSRLSLWDREDRMQDAILHVLEKKLCEQPQAYVIRAMKNRVLWDLREEWRTRKEYVAPEEFAVEDEISCEADFWALDWFAQLPPRDQLFLQGCAFAGISYVSRTLEIPYFTVRGKFQRMQHKIRRMLNDHNSPHKSN